MKLKILKNVLFLPITLALFSFEIPEGWKKAGSEPESYNMGIDKGSGQGGKNAATIKSNTQKIKGFGTLMQSCLAEKYLGKRIKMSGFVKSQNVEGWAGLWLRVDAETYQHKPLGFDNMQDRPIKNNSDWKKYEIILDVPLNAHNLAYGALLVGQGQIWFSDIVFEIVNQSVAPTNKECTVCSPILNEPSNLNFEK